MNAPRLDRDVIIVTALATGRTHAEAAKLAGCTARTVGRRLAVPEVRDALDVERMRLASEIADLLTGTARAAIDRLRRIATEGVDRDAVNAARVLLDQTTRHRDHAWVSDRLAALEDAVTARHGAA